MVVRVSPNIDIRSAQVALYLASCPLRNHRDLLAESGASCLCGMADMSSPPTTCGLQGPLISSLLLGPPTSWEVAVAQGIREVVVDKDAQGRYTHVRLIFGPHYFVELHRDSADRVTFVLGATHHGFRADASGANGELDSLIEEIRQLHPENLVD
jgi:hypothetical protein